MISGRVLTFSRDPVWLRSGAGTGEAGSGRDRPGVPRESEITDVLVNASRFDLVGAVPALMVPFMQMACPSFL